MDSGYSVQLEHAGEETSWQDQDNHGYVRIKAADGTELARVGGFQHNAKLRNGGAMDSAAVTQLVERAVKALAPAA